MSPHIHPYQSCQRWRATRAAMGRGLRYRSGPLLLLLLGLQGLMPAQDIAPTPLDQERWTVADAVASMPRLPEAVAPWRRLGLNVLQVAWEDTGRWQHSAVGPNISDLTIQLLGGPRLQRRTSHGWCMPVIRTPNFADVTADLAIERFRLYVGNERGAALQPLGLREYLSDFARYQHSPTGRLQGALVGERDRVVLVSSQAAILPIPRGEEVLFAPVLFNYQTRPGDPAVLAILVTPEGTSAQVIDNNPQASAGVQHGQRLYHNRNGQRAPLRATRFSDHPAGGAAPVPGPQQAARQEGLSLVMVIQVPLRQRQPRRLRSPAMAGPAAAAEMLKDAADVESAVVDSGPAEGPWLGLAGATIERDWRFPIRVTVQYYQASDGAVIPDDQVTRISEAIHRIYRNAEAVGSLVVDQASQQRPTAHQVSPPSWPAPWWEPVCRAYTERSGESWEEALRRVRERLGQDWQPADARELANVLELVRPR